MNVDFFVYDQILQVRSSSRLLLILIVLLFSKYRIIIIDVILINTQYQNYFCSFIHLIYIFKITHKIYVSPVHIIYRRGAQHIHNSTH